MHLVGLLSSRLLTSLPERVCTVEAAVVRLAAASSQEEGVRIKLSTVAAVVPLSVDAVVVRLVQAVLSAKLRNKLAHALNGNTARGAPAER